MKLSVLPVSLFNDIVEQKMTVAEWAQIGEALGLDAIDLSILFLQGKSIDKLKKMRAAIEAHDISVLMVTSYPDFTHPDKTERDKQFDMYQDQIVAAATVGAKALRVTAGQGHPEIAIQDGIKWAVEGITRCLDTAEKNGIELVYENHAKPGVWRYPDFNQPTEIFLAILEKLSSYPVKLLYDFANPIAYGDDSVSLLQKVVNQVQYVHVSDTATRGSLTPVMIGTGLVPVNDLFKILQDAGFDGYISIEEASNKGLKGVEQAVRNTRDIWVQAKQCSVKRNS